MRRALFVASLVALVACDTERPDSQQDAGGGPAPDAGGPTYHDVVAPLLARRCLSCHGAGGGIAGIDLTTYEAVHARALQIRDAVVSRRMPPYLADASGACNTFVDAEWLDDAEIATIVDWVGAEGPRGEPPEQAPEPAAPPVLEDANLVLDPGVDYSPPTNTDTYRCFVIDPGLDEIRHITGFEVRPGNDAIVHHVLLYDPLDQAGAAAAQARDAVEPGPGYTCFGGPGTPRSTVLAGWAPGLGAYRLPHGAGIELPPGRQLVMQVHYHVETSPPAPDRTRIALRVEERVPNRATTTLVAQQGTVLPAGEDGAVSLMEFRSGAPIPLTVFGVLPHMHEYGTRFTLERVAPEGDVCLTDLPRWDFDWQRIYTFERPLLLQPDDVLRMRCEYDTRARASAIGWGDDTTDEMCLVGVFAIFGETPDAVSATEIGPAVPRTTDETVGPDLSDLWSTSMRSLGSDRLMGLALEPDGHLWAVGRANNDVDIGGAQHSVTELAGFLSRFGPDGALDWTAVANGDGEDGLDAVALHPDGGAVAVGWTISSSVELGEHTLSADSFDGIVGRVDADGAWGWVDQVGDSGLDWVRGVAVDDVGYTWVALQFTEHLEFADRAVDANCAPEADFGDVALLRYQPDGTRERLVHLTVGGPDDMLDVADLAADAEGGVVVGGAFRGALLLDGETRLESRGDWDGFVARYAPDGSLSWHVHLGDAFDDGVADVERASDGAVVVGGRFSVTLGLEGTEVPFVGQRDAFVMSLRADTGAVEWARSLAGPGLASVQGISVDEAGRVAVSAEFGHSADLGDGVRLGGGMLYETALAIYDAGGDLLLARRFGSDGTDAFPQVAFGEGRIALSVWSDGDLELAGARHEHLANRDAHLGVFELPAE